MSEENIGTPVSKPSGRIAKNTFLLLVRMFILMVISLYSQRILLNSLGDDDYGLFNAVAGVVIMLTCVSTVLSISTQRFFSCELANNDNKKLNEIFSKSINLNVALAFLTLVLFETIGLWYVSCKMIIPPDRVFASHWVFQFSIFSFINILIQTPFMAAVMAHEDMGIYTIITTAECFLKFAVVLLIGAFDIDNMIFYGLGLWGVSLLVVVSYISVSVIRYQECRYKWQKNKKLYHELLTFSGWTFYGSLAGTAMIQGNLLLLNQFYRFSESAFVISMQIYNAFMQLCGSVVLAIRPAMIKNYSIKEYGKLNLLFSFCNKTLLLFITIIGIPLIFEMPTVLDIWLPDVSELKIKFARLMIIYVTVITMQNPITIIMQATGNIKNYHLYIDTILLLCIPVSCGLFYYEYPPETVLYSMIIVCIIAHFIRLYLLKVNYQVFSVKDYLLKFLIRSIIVTALTFMCVWGIHGLIEDRILKLIVVFSSTVVLQIGLCYLLVINRSEKLLVNKYVSKLIKRII